MSLLVLRSRAGRAPRKSPEECEQKALFDWAGLFPALRWLHAIPNGGHRTKAVAGKLKASGVKSGVLDVFLPVPVPPYHGLYIEMKAGKNKLSANQVEFKDFAVGQGYRVAVCYSSADAIAVVCEYMGIK